MQSFLNVGLGIFSLFSGFLTDNFGFFVLELFFVLLALSKKKKLLMQSNNQIMQYLLLSFRPQEWFLK